MATGIDEDRKRAQDLVRELWDAGALEALADTEACARELRYALAEMEQDQGIIQRLLREAAARRRMMLVSRVYAGIALVRNKELLPRGAFGAWLKEQGLTRSKANRLMRLVTGPETNEGEKTAGGRRQATESAKATKEPKAGLSVSETADLPEPVRRLVTIAKDCDAQRLDDLLTLANMLQAGTLAVTSNAGDVTVEPAPTKDLASRFH